MPKRTFQPDFTFCGTLMSIPSHDKMNLDEIVFFNAKWEVSNDTNLLHLQFYCQLKNICYSARELNKILGLNIKSKNHFISPDGNVSENIAYTTKDETKLINYLTVNNCVDNSNNIIFNEAIEKITLSFDMRHFNKNDLNKIDDINIGNMMNDEEIETIRRDFELIKKKCIKKKIKLNDEVNDEVNKFKLVKIIKRPIIK